MKISTQFLILATAMLSVAVGAAFGDASEAALITTTISASIFLAASGIIRAIEATTPPQTEKREAE